MPDWQQVGQHFANKYQIPWQLFNAMINQESGWNPKAKSPAGAIGFGQLMPGTAQGLGVNPYNPRQNLKGAAMYLANQYNNFGKWNLALSAYNSGPGGSESSGKVEGFPETQNYVRAIMAAYSGRNRTGLGQAFMPSGQGSFTAIDPKSLDAMHRKQAALSLLASDPNSGFDEAFTAALGKKIGEGVETKRYRFNYGVPGHDLEGAKLMRAIVALAMKRGLTVGENPKWGGVNPVHTEGSFHYQTFPGHPHLGRAVDINYYGDAPSASAQQAIESQKLLGLFRAIRRRYGFQNIEELLAPGRTYFAGGPISHSTYSGHDNHLHLAI